MPAKLSRRVILPIAASVLIVVAGASSALLGVCGPFTDVAADAFCPLVLEIFYLGITTGTTATTYSPSDNVTRLQMAAFLSRSVDGVLRRGSRRAALNHFWTPQSELSLAMTTVGGTARQVASDGTDVWVANGAGTVTRVRGGDGKLLETWTGADLATGVLTAIGAVFVTGSTNPGNLYQVDPTRPAGAVTTVASNLGKAPQGIAFDGSRLWTANDGSVSIVTPAASLPWPVTTVSSGFAALFGMLYDGGHMWVTDITDGNLLKLNGIGGILQTVTVGSVPGFPVFDGTNIWVPNFGSNTISVVRASNGTVLATLTGNGLNKPDMAAFDGERILVTNFNAGADSVSLWKAADLSVLGAFSTGAGSLPIGACSDGAYFWITLQGTSKLARF